MFQVVQSNKKKSAERIYIGKCLRIIMRRLNEVGDLIVGLVVPSSGTVT